MHTESETCNTLNSEQRELQKLNHDIKELEEEIFNNSQILKEIVKKQKNLEEDTTFKDYSLKPPGPNKHKILTNKTKFSCSYYNCKR